MNGLRRENTANSSDLVFPYQKPLVVLVTEA
jgi:hypothetical protein